MSSSQIIGYVIIFIVIFYILRYLYKFYVKYKNIFNRMQSIARDKGYTSQQVIENYNKLYEESVSEEDS